jgi:DNA-binding response OmpR family regulator
VGEGTRPPAARILLVEDDAAVQLLVRTAVEAVDRELHVVTTVREARAALAEGGVDAVVLDLFLPDGDGRGLLAEIRDQRASAVLPVVVLSGRGARATQLECYELGADEFFEKPFDPEILGAAVERQLVRAHQVAGTAPARPTPPEPAPTQVAKQAGERAPQRILMVEDDETTVALVRHRLEREGIEVVHRSRGTDVPELLTMDGQGPAYDLVLLDVKVPGLGGFELLEELRSRPAWKDVPVVMLTGMGRESDVVRAFALGANDYVLKPFSPVELLARVNRLLGQ